MKRLVLVPLLALSACYTPKTVAQIKREVPAYDVRGIEWEQTHISYWRDYDERDEFRPCDRTLELGFGDCDDYAKCSYEMTADWNCEDRRIINYQPHYGGYYDERWHAVTFLRCDAGSLYGYFDNGEWKKGKPK